MQETFYMCDMILFKSHLHFLWLLPISRLPAFQPGYQNDDRIRAQLVLESVLDCDYPGTSTGEFEGFRYNFNCILYIIL